MEYYQTKSKQLPGTEVSEVIETARLVYRQAVKSTRRRPYVRSVYFDKEKIFLDNFWPHLYQKSYSERSKRLRLLPCAIELIQHSRFAPSVQLNPNNHAEVLHRFYGRSKDGKLFGVQIKEDIKRGQKFFMSVFVYE